MKKLLILGAGTAGTIMANKMRKELPDNEWNITIIDREKDHYYQPGFLFVPFGLYKMNEIVKPVSKFIPSGVVLINAVIEKIDAPANKVILSDNSSFDYDILIIATGVRMSPEETTGMNGKLWGKSIFDFYTPEGAEALAGFFKTWEGGKLVINIADNPIKCPVAPLEFAFYADEYFIKKGMRDKVEIIFVTPMSGAFTKPRAAKMLGAILEKKKINIVTDFFIGEVDNDNKKIIDFGGREVSFDCLVSIPLHTGDQAIMESGLGDEFGFVKADKFTLQSVVHKNVFVIGDAGNFPTSKAGSVAHFQADILHENLMSYIHGKPLTAKSDGHSNCFIESGFGKGILIDFNYDTEPLAGLFPVPVIGPMSLLKENRANHIGKLLFRWVYWNILLKARWLPISNKMSLAGKKVN